MTTPRTAFTILLLLSCGIAAFAVTPARSQPQATWHAPFTIAAPPAIGCAGPDYSSVGLAGNDAGESVAIWTGGAGPQVTVHAAIRRPGAATFDAPQTLTPPGDGALNLNPAVVIDGAGNATAVWVQLDAASNSRLQASFRPAGGQFGAPVDVSPDVEQVSKNAPALGVDGQGNVTAIWLEAKTGITYPLPRPNPIAIRAATRPANGDFGAHAFLAGSLDYADTSLGGAGLRSAGLQSIVVNKAGDALALWWFEDIDSSPPPEYVRQPQVSFRPSGASFGATEMLDTYEFSDTAGPRAALDDKGNAVIAWSLLGGPLPAGLPHMGVWVAERPAGGPVGARKRLAAYDEAASDPEVSIDTQGAATVVWTGIQGAATRIDASVRPPGGDFGAPHAISATGTGAHRPVAVADGQGNTLVAWQEAAGVQVASRPPGGSFGGPQTVSGAGEVPAGPQLAFAANGDGVAAWLDEADPDCPTIRAAVFGPAASQGTGSPAAPTSTGTAAPTTPTPAKAAAGFKIVGKARLSRRAIALTLDLPAAGRVRLKATTPDGRRVLGTTTVRAGKKGRTRLRLRLRRPAPSRLRLSIVFTPAGGKPSTQTVTLRR